MTSRPDVRLFDRLAAMPLSLERAALKVVR